MRGPCRAFTPSTTNPPRKGDVIGQNFVDTYPQYTAGASGNVIVLGASRVISVDVSGLPSGDVNWSYAKPTLTIPNLVNGSHYDITVTYI